MGDESNFDDITNALLAGGVRRRRSHRGGAGRRGSIAAVLKAQGIAPETAETLAAKIDEVALIKEFQVEVKQKGNATALVTATADLGDQAAVVGDALKTVLNDQLNNVANSVAAVWEGLKTASVPAAVGATGATGGIIIAGWRSQYVRTAMNSMMPLIIEDLKAAAKENVGAALTVSALLSAALVIFLMLFFNRLTRAMKPTDESTPKEELTVANAELQGAKAAELAVVPTGGKSAEIQAKIKVFQEKAMAALAEEKAGRRPSRWGPALTNAPPMDQLTNGSTGGRRLTSRRRRRAAYSPKPTRRSSSGRRRGYSRRQRG
jgi:hypothetical protein